MPLLSAIEEAQRRYRELAGRLAQAPRAMGGFVQRYPTPRSYFGSPQFKQTARNFLARPVPQPFQPAARAIISGSQRLQQSPVGIPNQLMKEYGINRMARPIAQARQSFQQPGLANKAMGALGLAGAGFSALPVSVPFAGLDAVKAAVQARRTRQPVGAALRQGFTGQKYVGLGESVTDNPRLAATLNVGEFLAPFSGGAIKKLAKLRAGKNVRNLQNVTKGKGGFMAPIEELLSHEGAPDRKRVEYYKKLIQEGKGIDPLKIIREGAKYGVEDGKHRLQALKELGYKTAPVELVKGPQAKGAQPPLYDVKEPLYHYTDADIKGGVLKSGKHHPQNYLGDGVYVTNQKAGYPGKNEYQVEMPKNAKLLDLTQGKKAENLAKKVANKLGIPYEPQGGLYDDLRQMEYQLNPNKVGDLATQTKIRKIVDELTEGYDAVKAPWSGTLKDDNFYEVLFRNQDVPIKSQLTDIYNQATKKGVVPEGTMGFLGASKPTQQAARVVTQMKSTVPPVGGQSTQPLSGSISQETQSYLSELTGKQVRVRQGPGFGMKQKATSFLGEIKRKFVDSVSPIEDVLFEAEKKGKFKVLPKQDFRLQVDRVLRSPTLAGQFVKDNGLDTVIKNVDDIDALDQYLIAKQASRVSEFGKETGRNIERDKRLVEELGPKYEQYAKAVTDYGKKLKQYMVDSGLISKELSATLEKKYPDYVPLNRIFTELEKGGGFGGTKAVASLSRQSVIQKLEGSKREIEGPLGSLITKTQSAFEQGEKNVAARQLASYKDLPIFKDVMRELKPGESGKHTISYLEDGVKRIFEVTPEIEAAAKSLNKEQIGLIGKILRVPTRVLQAGATSLNLPFTLTNLAKDQVTAFINSNKTASTSLLNPANFVRALFSAVKHDDLYQDLVRSAGGGTAFDISRSQPQLNIQKIRAGKTLGSKIKYTVTHPEQLLRAVEDIIGRGEEVTRIQQYRGTYQQLLKEGRTAQDAKLLAAQAARQNTANFARSGDWGKVLNATIPFFNAGIQGARTLVRSFQQRPKETIAKLGVGVFFPMATVTAWNLSDPNRKAVYEDIPEYEKANNLIIIPDGSTKDDKGRYNVIKIPVPPGISNLSSLIRRPIEASEGLDPVRFKDVAANIITAGTSLNVGSPRELVSSLTPQALKAPIETITNTNLFTGKQIIPEYLKNKPPEEQVYPHTSGTARLAGRVLNTSPLAIENAVRTTAAGVGSQALNLSDRALSAIGAIPPEQVSGEGPIANLKRRFSRASGGEVLDRAYTEKGKQDALKKEALRLISIGRKDDAKQLAQENQIKITVKDFKEYQSNLTQKAADLYVEGKEDTAKRMAVENKLTLTKGEVKKAARRRAIELYRLGLKDESKELVQKYGIVLTRKDIE